MPIHIPPLRERKEDIPLFIDNVLLGIARESGSVTTLTDDTLEVLMNYGWPGNVRELISVIKRAAVMCEGNRITRDDLPLHLKGEYTLTGGAYSDTSLDDTISELEKNMIIDALKKTQRSQAKAAKLLGISERSMWYRVKKYEIDIN
jgi:transcriptional regulator with PAS, ATPase and Fis domain